MTDVDASRPTRRAMLIGAGALGAVPLLIVRRAEATPDTMKSAIHRVIGESPVGKGPMTAKDHVKAIHVFNEKNPQPDVVSVHLGPRSGRAAFSTRIRLADSQTVVAIAELSDGSLWSDSVDVIVTIAACLEYN
jgi:sulfur-oxidizing protein SoxY